MLKMLDYIHITSIPSSCQMVLQLISSLVGRIIGCRALLVSSCRYVKGNVLSYVSQANVIYSVVSLQISSFYVLC